MEKDKYCDLLILCAYVHFILFGANK